MRTKAKYLPIGSISEGTLRAEDVIPELLYTAESVRMSRADRAKACELAREWHRIADGETDETVADLAEVWWELEDLLSCYAPPGCYVGGHEGDGASIGCWPRSDVPCTENRDATAAELDKIGPDGTVFYLSDHGDILGVWSACYAHGSETRWHYLSL